MRASTGFLTAFGLLLLALPASAGFLAEKVDEGVYFVSYQRAQILRGSLIWDTEKKVQRRLERKVNEFCVAQGYTGYRIPTLGEIARDDALRAIWQLAVGDEARNTSDNEGGGGVYGDLRHVHKSRRLVLLSTEPGPEWLPCHAEPTSPEANRAAAASAGAQDASSLVGDGATTTVASAGRPTGSQPDPDPGRP